MRRNEVMTNNTAVEASATSPLPGLALSAELLHRRDAHWRASNHLSVGQIYLYDNPPLKPRWHSQT